MSDEMTPSATIVASANDTVELTDAGGRKLTVRKLSVLDQVRLMRAMGEHSSNSVYAFAVQCAASVSRIDGKPQPFPTDERRIDAMIQRLGDDGFAAVQQHVLGEMKATKKRLEAAMAENDDGEEEAAAA